MAGRTVLGFVCVGVVSVQRCAFGDQLRCAPQTPCWSTTRRWTWRCSRECRAAPPAGTVPPCTVRPVSCYRDTAALSSPSRVPSGWPPRQRVASVPSVLCEREVRVRPISVRRCVTPSVRPPVRVPVFDQLSSLDCCDPPAFVKPDCLIGPKVPIARIAGGQGSGNPKLQTQYPVTISGE